jgi:hypothetical protein
MSGAKVASLYGSPLHTYSIFNEMMPRVSRRVSGIDYAEFRGGGGGGVNFQYTS